MGRAAVGLLLLGTALSLAGCGASTHTSKNTRLILGRSIGPISFGETKTKIEADYGRAQRVTWKSGTARPVVDFYPAVSIGVIYSANSQGKPAAVILETDAPQYHTRSGIGVGSTVANLKKNGVECGLTVDSCQIGISTSKPGTTFFLDDQGTRVARVAIATGH
jgi:hypothetical protein